MRLCFAFLTLFSLQFFGQSPYKLKLLFEADFPRRLQIGVKLLSSKPVSFTLKGGYQLPALSWGSYRGESSNITKPLSLSGPVAGIGTELNFKNPKHKISLEMEYGNLTGSYSNPSYIFNGGRDYWVTRSIVLAQSYTILLGYAFHFRSNYNLSVFAKTGLIYRHSKEHFYYKGSRLPNAKNQLEYPYNVYYLETEATLRIGIQYCFGHSKLAQ